MTTPQPDPLRQAWQALIDDLYTEFDQGHMKVWAIVQHHRPAIDAAARHVPLEAVLYLAGPIIGALTGFYWAKVVYGLVWRDPG
jgi:hypothetical protein